MVDFRKLISPRSQKSLREEHERLIGFQQLNPVGMAQILLEKSRILIDSGLFSNEQNYSYDERALYRIIPMMAKILDPDIELRPEEIPDESERKDPVTWIENRSDLMRGIQATAEHGSFSRGQVKEAPSEVVSAVRLLFDRGVNAFKVSADTLSPGLYPDRVTPDTRDPLDGFYVTLGLEDRDSVIRYCDDISTANRYFDTAICLIEDREVPEVDEEIASSITRRYVRFSDAESLKIENFDGDVRREYAFEAEPDAEMEISF